MRAVLLVLVGAVCFVGVMLWSRAERSDVHGRAGEPPGEVESPRARLLDAAVAAAAESAPIEGTAATRVEPVSGAETRSAAGSSGNGIVHGRVTDEAGALLEGWAPAVALIDGRGEAREVEADARGRFTFAGVGAGRGRLAAEAVGYRRKVVEFELAEGEARECELVLAKLPWLVVRVVTPEGEPLAQAVRGEAGLGMLRYELVARATLGASPAPIKGAVSGAFSWSLAQHCANSPSSACSANQAEFGSYWRGKTLQQELGADGIGVLVLEREPPLFVELLRGAEVLARERVEPGSDEVRFVLTGAELRARSAGLRVRALDAPTRRPLVGTATFQRPLADPLEWTLDANGALEAEGLAPGTGELRIASAGHELLRRELVLAPGQTLELGELLLQPEARLELRVEDGFGRPLAARFALAPLDAGASGFLADEFVSDASGSLSVGSLRAGRYLVRSTDDGARAEDGSVWSLAPTEIATGAPTTLQLVPSAELVLLGTDSLPFRASLRLTRDSLLLFESPLVAGWLPRFSLAPGDYRLELFDARGAPLVTRVFTLPPAGLELDLAR